jgi:hypothetical protein
MRFISSWPGIQDSTPIPAMIGFAWRCDQQSKISNVEANAFPSRTRQLSVAYCTWFQKNPLTHGCKVIGFTRVEMEGICVRLDGEAFRSPALKATLEEFYP